MWKNIILTCCCFYSCFNLNAQLHKNIDGDQIQKLLSTFQFEEPPLVLTFSDEPDSANLSLFNRYGKKLGEISDLNISLTNLISPTYNLHYGERLVYILKIYYNAGSVYREYRGVTQYQGYHCAG